MSIKTVCRVVFGQSDIHIFEENTVKVFCAVYILRGALCSGYKRFINNLKKPLSMYSTSYAASGNLIDVTFDYEAAGVALPIPS